MPLARPQRMLRKAGLNCGLTLVLSSAALAVDESRLEVSGERVEADDLRLELGSVRVPFIHGDWSGAVSVSRSAIRLDYEPAPFDFRGESVDLDESTVAAQLNVERELGEGLWLALGLGGYDGFTNFRSVWLDEYYRQQFGDLSGVEGAEDYVQAKPMGLNAVVGARWEYRPAAGFAQLTVSALDDDVSPGYEIDFDGLRRGEMNLSTLALALSSENVLTKRIRSKVEALASKTSEREWRYGLRGAINWAAGSSWIIRAELGGTTERPQFDAYFGQLAVERSLGERWSVYSSYRYYRDTGEIENAFLFSAAAPGLESRRGGVGLRWQGERIGIRAYLGRADADYEATRLNTDFFQNLYRDRKLWIYQLAAGWMY